MFITEITVQTIPADYFGVESDSPIYITSVTDVVYNNLMKRYIQYRVFDNPRPVSGKKAPGLQV